MRIFAILYLELINDHVICGFQRITVIDIKHDFGGSNGNHLVLDYYIALHCIVETCCVKRKRKSFRQ